MLCIVLLGGTATNFIWCAILIAKNRTGREFFGGAGLAADGVAKPPLLRNYLLCALAGITWCFQSLLLHHGRKPDGFLRLLQLDSTHGQHHHLLQPVGFALKEWRGASRQTLTLVFVGLALLVGSTVIIGLGNAMAV